MKQIVYFFILVLLSVPNGYAEPAPNQASTGSELAKNIILFIGDGTGIPTLNAASIHGYGKPLQLYLQQMPHIGLSETSAANRWVTDSAAGMTAIVTGEKTNNGVISQADDGVRGEKDGRELKTILEEAEERGLSTGVVTNSPVWDATPAACYAHSNNRSNVAEIVSFWLTPRYGDGVDVIIGPGRERILKETQEAGIDILDGVQKKGYLLAKNEEELKTDVDRIIGLYADEPYQLRTSVFTALEILERNEKGFFLMVESNNHSKDVQNVLDRVVEMDRIIAEVAKRFEGTPTLIIYTADHSYGLHLPGGPKAQDVVPHVEVVDSHTGEEVLAAATGPGAKRVRGMFPNTYLYHIMKKAMGW
ncbi:MAG TPA: alkaline phosphatase [Acidobacteriota bacterium]|nr:alkaline phosphatase [Acidobacteriota bacterium]